MDSTVAVVRPALVFALAHPGIDYETVLESLEDHLCLRHGQRQRLEGTPTLCIWRSLRDDREAVLDGFHLQLTGTRWFGADSGPYVEGLRRVAEMLPLEIEATGVNPIFELRISSPKVLERVVRLGESFADAFPHGACLAEILWWAPMPEGGQASFRLRLREDPWRISVDCNWHMDHGDGAEGALARWQDFERQARELSSRLMFAFAGV